MAIEIDREELREIVEGAAEKAVRTTLEALGVDPSEKSEMRADFAHLRRWRKAVTKAENAGFVATVTIIVSGLFAAAWIGIKLAITGHSN